MLCRHPRRHCAADDEIHTVLRRIQRTLLQHGIFRSEIRAQLYFVDFIEIGHVREHVGQSHNTDDRHRLVDDLSGSHHEKSHFLSRHHQLHHRDRGVILNERCLQSAGNDEGCSRGCRCPSFADRFFCFYNGYPADIVLFFLQDIVCKIRHVVPGQKQRDSTALLLFTLFFDRCLHRDMLSIHFRTTYPVSESGAPAANCSRSPPASTAFPE